MYLLSAVLILLAIFGEYGPKGLCLLLFACLIPVVVDSAVLRLAGGLSGVPLYLAVTGGKELPILLVPLLRRFKSLFPGKRLTESDGDSLLLRQHMEMQQESMTALEQNYRMQRKSAHEFEHHLQVLRDLLDREETDAARDYLNRLKKNRSIHVMSVSSNHPVIDVILNQKYQTARENEIKMQIQVNDLSALTVPTDSLVVVLTNLLDNAIEACRRLDGYREIFCSVLYDDGLYISIRNTSEEVTVVDGKIPTSKQDSLSHGFGLMSVTYVLEKLDAEYTFGYDEGWFHFAAEIE
jgi:sensor histidine kinase regulating citrate/malate metabolism